MDGGGLDHEDLAKEQESEAVDVLDDVRKREGAASYLMEPSSHSTSPTSSRSASSGTHIASTVTSTSDSPVMQNSDVVCAVRERKSRLLNARSSAGAAEENLELPLGPSETASLRNRYLGCSAVRRPDPVCKAWHGAKAVGEWAIRGRRLLKRPDRHGFARAFSMFCLLKVKIKVICSDDIIAMHVRADISLSELVRRAAERLDAHDNLVLAHKAEPRRSFVRLQSDDDLRNTIAAGGRQAVFVCHPVSSAQRSPRQK